MVGDVVCEFALAIPVCSVAVEFVCGGAFALDVAVATDSSGTVLFCYIMLFVLVFVVCGGWRPLFFHFLWLLY